MLTAAKSFPSERTAFEECAVKAITHSLELTVAESIASLEAIVEVTAQPLGRVITIGSETGLIPLSFPGVYVQRTPKQEKLSKSELNSLTVPELRDRIAKAVKNNNSLVAPKSYKKAKKVVLVDWLMAN